ncbi:hypothetical protein EVAR_67058_1 [Eumeta japonica]|uniref:Uncharacterized protein n=1 Tax=Eumeta variegata TaxID=151549 RepID=A0A4C1ZKS1_EUMVA|nr:hypothetical protein EVAR_67058_1 [Eumeta japonica]
MSPTHHRKLKERRCGARGAVGTRSGRAGGGRPPLRCAHSSWRWRRRTFPLGVRSLMRHSAVGVDAAAASRPEYVAVNLSPRRGRRVAPRHSVI